MKEVFNLNFKYKTMYTRSHLLFLTSYAIWVSFALLRYTYIGKMFSFSHYRTEVSLIVLFLLALKFGDDGVYHIRNFIGLAITFYIGIIEYFVQDRTVAIFILCVFILSSGNVAFDDILKTALLIDVCIFVVTVTLSIKGIIPNNVWDVGIRERYDLGFTYCTFSSHLMLFITMIYCCIRKRISFSETMVLGFLNIWLFSYTDTRLDLFIVLPYLLYFYIWTIFSNTVNDHWFNRVLFEYGGIILASISILAQAMYNPNINLYVMFNNLLSNRLELGNNAISEYGFHLFGQQIKWVGQGSLKKNPLLTYNYVDCSFLKYTLNYGIIFSIMLGIVLIYIGRRAIEKKNQALCVSLLFLYVFAMVDAELCVLAFHPFLLTAGELLNPPVGGKNEKESEGHSFR